MRYAKSESTYILGIFNTGDTVTIDVYRLSDNAKVVDGASCSEVGGTGVFKYFFSQTVSQKEEYLWMMSNGEYSKYGKIVLGGWMDTVNEKMDILAKENTVQFIKTQIDELLDIEEGNWEIKNNQMIFYRRNGEELMRFNLLDKDGMPCEIKVYKREKV